jgi:hypothetical protein
VQLNSIAVSPFVGWRTHASAAAVLFTVVAVYFASSSRAAEVRAAIKLTNFSMLLYAPGQEYSNGNLFYFPLARTL